MILRERFQWQITPDLLLFILWLQDFTVVPEIVESIIRILNSDAVFRLPLYGVKFFWNTDRHGSCQLCDLRKSHGSSPGSWVASTFCMHRLRTLYITSHPTVDWVFLRWVFLLCPSFLWLLLSFLLLLCRIPWALPNVLLWGCICFHQ